MSYTLTNKSNSSPINKIFANAILSFIELHFSLSRNDYIILCIIMFILNLNKVILAKLGTQTMPQICLFIFN